MCLCDKVIFLLKLIVLLGVFYVYLLSISFTSIGFILISNYLSKLEFESIFYRNEIVTFSIGIIVGTLMPNSIVALLLCTCAISIGPVSDFQATTPVLMGVNMGKTLTNCLVTLTLRGNAFEFKRGYRVAVLNDLFNVFTSVTLLLIEIITDFFYNSTSLLTIAIFKNRSSAKCNHFLNPAFSPITDLFVRLNESMLAELAKGLKNTTKVTMRDCANNAASNYSMKSDLFNRTNYNCSKYVTYGIVHQLGDTTTGFILIGGSLLSVTLCLFAIVRLTDSIIKNGIAERIKQMFVRLTNAGSSKYKIEFMAFLVGFFLTLVVQSSNVITSTLTILHAGNHLNIDQVYSIIVGSNVASSIVIFFVSLNIACTYFKNSFEMALSYLFIYLYGLFAWYLSSIMRFPIRYSEKFEYLAYKYDWFVYYYMLMLYLIGPFVLLGLGILPKMSGLALLFVPFVVLSIIFFVIRIVNYCSPDTLADKIKEYNCYQEKFSILEFIDKIFKKFRPEQSATEPSRPLFPVAGFFLAFVSELARKSTVLKSFLIQPKPVANKLPEIERKNDEN